MAIDWTKKYNATKNGEILTGADLGNIQDDIDAGFTGNATYIQEAPVDTPLEANDDEVLYYDFGNNKFAFKRVMDLFDDQTIAGVKTFSGTVDAATLKVGTTNQGDILYDNGTSIVRLTPGTDGQLLTTKGAAANPEWAAAPVVSTPMIEWKASEPFTNASSVSISETASNGDCYRLVYNFYTANNFDPFITINSDSAGTDYDVILKQMYGTSETIINKIATGLSQVELDSIYGGNGGKHSLVMDIFIINSDTVCKFSYTRFESSNLEEIVGSFTYNAGTMTSIQLINNAGVSNMTGRYYLGKYTQ